PQTVSTLQQDPRSPARTYEVQRNIIFRGRATVSNGQFVFNFVVPRDINYTFGPGKVSYYAADPSQRTDASGAYNELIIGGTDTNAVADDQGPIVEVFMNDENFIPGGEVGTEAILFVKLSDDLGINVTGNSIGHDLEAVIDDDTRNPIVLNDYYEAATDDFTRGEVRFPLFDLEPGPHTISVRAWDVANNSATGSTDFVVSADGSAAITRVLNYPNPFTDRTCFQFDHTLTGQDVQVLVQVYTVSGRLVKTLEGDLPFSDGAVRLEDCIEWDGLDDYGDQLARGVYLYQVRLKGEGDNNAQSDLQRLVILK
ncbi:MAG: oxidoreductase, partial [Bacteroidota bacterium]